jgi:hypothetical protein
MAPALHYYLLEIKHSWGWIMSALQKQLIERAREAYPQIFPCTSKQSFDECFTIFGTKCLFWFNTADNSTHMLVAEISED